MMIRAQRLECFLGAITRRRQPVRTEPDPREDGGERDFVEKIFLRDRAGAAKKEMANVGHGKYKMRNSGSPTKAWIGSVAPPAEGAGGTNDATERAASPAA